MKHIADSTYQEATAPPTLYPPQEEIEETLAPRLLKLGGPLWVSIKKSEVNEEETNIVRGWDLDRSEGGYPSSLQIKGGIEELRATIMHWMHREISETRGGTRGLYWFGPTESETLRPVWWWN
jgi:hypothetical protein